MMMYIYAAIIFILTISYSTIRYNYFGEIPVSDIPTFILNKAIAFSMIIFLFMNFLKHNTKNKEEKNNYWNIFKTSAIIHLLLSIVLLSESYYPKLYSNDKLTLIGNISIVAGIISIVYLNNKFSTVKYSLLYLIISIHLFFLGFKGWLNIEKWNGKLPPITLICFFILVVIFVISIIRKSKNTKSDSTIPN